MESSNDIYEFIDGWLIRDRAPFQREAEVRKATVFALANGYMGSRGAPESAPLDWPGVVGHHINGLYDSPTGDILQREMINIPAWTPILLEADGQALAVGDAACEDYVRELDLRRGLLRQSARWTLPGGGTLEWRSERLVSMAHPHLAAIRWRLVASRPCRITLVSAIDARVTNRFAPTHSAATAAQAVGGDLTVTLITIEQRHQVTVMVRHRLTGGAQRARWSWRADEARAEGTVTFDLPAAQMVTLVKFVSVHDSRFTPGDLPSHCRADLYLAEALGYDVLRAGHAARWAELWDSSDVTIEGDPQAQTALRFCLFHLLANSPHSDRVSISARGLQGQDYWGSIFWDCDIYVAPFFTATQPALSRRLLRYRYHTLDGARRKAQGLGFAGAYYAWQSQESGDETCALYVFDDPLTGQKIRSYFADEQIHISADVVYALWQYLQASGDDSILADGGLEIACEVARFFVSRATYNAEQDRYELRTVLGPDEYHERVDNNAYTNAMAQLALRVALSLLERTQRRSPHTLTKVRARLSLGDDEIAQWREVAERFYVPAPDPQTGLIPQFDGYFALEDAPPDVVRSRLAHPDQYPGGPLGPYQSTQAIKQADVVLLLYLLRDRYSADVQRANWLYYEPRTAHDSSLSPLAYALVAANVGMVDWAHRYFLRTAMLDLLGTGPHWNLGVHTAAMGGAWLSVVHGFCQLDLRDDGVHLLDWPRLPADWRAVRLTLWWHGHCVGVRVTPQTVTFTVEGGTVPIVHPAGRASASAASPLTLSYSPAPAVSLPIQG